MTGSHFYVQTKAMHMCSVNFTVRHPCHSPLNQASCGNKSKSNYLLINSLNSMLIAILWPHSRMRWDDRTVNIHHKKTKNENANWNSLIPSIYLKVRSKILPELWRYLIYKSFSKVRTGLGSQMLNINYTRNFIDFQHFSRVPYESGT